MIKYDISDVVCGIYNRRVANLRETYQHLCRSLNSIVSQIEERKRQDRLKEELFATSTSMTGRRPKHIDELLEEGRMSVNHSNREVK